MNLFSFIDLYDLRFSITIETAFQIVSQMIFSHESVRFTQNQSFQTQQSQIQNVTTSFVSSNMLGFISSEQNVALTIYGFADFYQNSITNIIETKLT